MHIKSLEIVINDTKIITDIDDCLFLSSKSIRENGLSKRVFWFDEDTYESNKHQVFENAELTEWGKEFIDMVANGFSDYTLITAGRNRTDILINKLGVKEENIIQAMSDEEKADYLNCIEKDCIYVDDKMQVIRELNNANVTPINYPKKMQVYTRRVNTNRRFRRKF